ncbi:MAG: (2Fe-2S) ferredoxin domain-containing protein [Clostridia bacterium]|nr:(2Fe-2S) ferredoxin domain-containing protein [Clostridia bacterium]
MIKLSVCSGMGCRMFGAEDTPGLFQKELERLGLSNRVEMTRSCCMGECSRGPCVRVNGTKHRGVDQNRVKEFVAKEILPLAKEQP